MSRQETTDRQKPATGWTLRAGNALLNLRIWNSPWAHWAALIMAGLLFLLLISVPLEATEQAIFALICFVVTLLLSRVAGRLATLMMIMLSVGVSLRYMYWRVTSTLGFETPLDMLFGYGLVIAEFYALTVLLLSYFQSAWPLRRRPLPMPADTRNWPTVDVFIPTYSEPLEVVRQTVLAAMSLDWPANKVKVYLLDDGRRPEFREFCERVGVGYITRPDNKHAKAGNINAALSKTDGEFVAVFDCDHVPTRSFLQISMGWFLKDPKLSMLQTPHVFFSPDPFEKNLETFRNVPNEGELFYGLIQDGNDLWNATFFCGSCAVMRRSAIAEIGGIATESVTEDALTALKMNRAGYNTAYLAVPQAAGLATENLSRHIGQRIRWARGMAQIIRLNNPLLGRGLKLGQRLCYLSATLHFFHGLPRVVFLTAPLAYLFFGAHVFQASALLIALYALPHLVHASVTNSRIQGRFRHSFWNEVYESVLAWYIMRPALQTLIQPHRARFNVTAKGGVIPEAYFDWTLARPYLVLLVLNLLGMTVGVLMLVLAPGDTDHTLTVAVNLAWTAYNIIITAASVAVAGEVRQLRSTPRVSADLAATVHLANGRTLACRTTDFSQGGVGLTLPGNAQIPLGEALHISLYRDEEEGVFPGQVTFSKPGHLGVGFRDLSIQQELDLARVTFARADTWANMWGQNTPDSPLMALRHVCRIGMRGLSLITLETFSGARRAVRGAATRSASAATRTARAATRLGSAKR